MRLRGAHLVWACVVLAYVGTAVKHGFVAANLLFGLGLFFAFVAYATSREAGGAEQHGSRRTA